MCLHVGCQCALDGEGAVALGALVRLLVCMDADVANEVTRLLKLLRAVGALVPSDAVDLSQM